MSRRRLIQLFWGVLALSMINYAVMAIWSLAALENMAAGLLPFDLRTEGYSHADAVALVSALGDRGAEFYLNVQHRLDLTYPMLTGLALGLAIFLLSPPAWGAWRWALAAVSVPGPIFDFFENAAVARLLTTGTGQISPAMVETANQYTSLKLLTISAAMLLVLTLLVFWIARKVLARRKNPVAWR